MASTIWASALPWRWNPNRSPELFYVRHRTPPTRARVYFVPCQPNCSAPQFEPRATRARDKERDVAEDSNSGASGGLYFVVGGLVVAVGVLVFVFMGGHIPSHSGKVDVTIEAPKTQ